MFAYFFYRIHCFVIFLMCLSALCLLNFLKFCAKIVFWEAFSHYLHHNGSRKLTAKNILCNHIAILTNKQTKSLVSCKTSAVGALMKLWPISETLFRRKHKRNWIYAKFYLRYWGLRQCSPYNHCQSPLISNLDDTEVVFLRYYRIQWQHKRWNIGMKDFKSYKMIT